MTREEELVRATTTAIASAVRDVPPLRLTPASGDALEARLSEPRASQARRLRGWLAPVTAAALVIALAVALVIIRDLPNGPVVPASPARSAAGIPAYYVTLYQPPQQTTPTPSPSASSASGLETPVVCPAGGAGCSVPPTDLLVGDTFTGAQVTTVTPPTGNSFYGVTAAADDRTFVVDTNTQPGVSDIDSSRAFYRLTIAPGTASPARLTRLAIPSLTGVIAIALSASGRELAVATLSQKSSLVRLRIYAVSNGRLLRGWSTDDQTVFDRGADLIYDENRGLTWVNGDRGLAFPAFWMTRKQVGTIKVGKRTFPKMIFAQHMTVRTLGVTGGGSELITDSKVIWSAANRTIASYPPGCRWYQDPLVSGDGKTIDCVSVTGPPDRGPNKEIVHWRMSWLANSASTPSVARPLYKFTIDAPLASGFWLDGLWTSASGTAVLGYWYFGNLSKPLPVHFGVMSHGTFRPLPTPPTIIPGDPFGIAW
jgi:hypothetical protein